MKTKLVFLAIIAFLFSTFCMAITPNVTLIAPAGTTLYNIYPTLNCTASANVTFITFYANYSGSWTTVSNASPALANQTWFTTQVTNGNYTWNCYACNVTACAFAPANATFEVRAPSGIAEVTNLIPLLVTAVFLLTLSLWRNNPILSLLGAFTFIVTGMAIFQVGGVTQTFAQNSVNTFNSGSYFGFGILLLGFGIYLALLTALKFRGLRGGD